MGFLTMDLLYLVVVVVPFDPLSFSSLKIIYLLTLYELTLLSEASSFSKGSFTQSLLGDDFRSRKIGLIFWGRSRTVYCLWSGWSAYVEVLTVWGSLFSVKTPFAFVLSLQWPLWFIIKESTSTLWDPIGQYLYCIHDIRNEVLSGYLNHRHLVLLNLYCLQLIRLGLLPYLPR